MNWLIARFKEPSTYRGLIWIFTAFGVSIRPELWDSIVVLGMGIAGFLGVVMQDKPNELPPIELIGKADNEQQRAHTVQYPFYGPDRSDLSVPVSDDRVRVELPTDNQRPTESGFNDR